MSSTNYRQNKSTEPFKIDHVDPLGQGVSKLNNKIVFVRKTLPDETGFAKVLKSKKGVSFAEKIHLEEASPKRIEPVCPHFETCPSCHFLHTPYDEEIHFKVQTLERDLSYALPKETKLELQVHRAPQRVNYRTRIQLHFDQKHQQLGYVDPLHADIISVPDCKIAVPEVTQRLVELYQNQSWKELIPKGEGHLEIALTERGELLTSVNKPYSAGGFRQVYPEMNDKLLEVVRREALFFLEQKGRSPVLVDLFGGSGNLSKPLPEFQSTVVDSHVPKIASKDHQSFFQIDLYSPFAIGLFEKLTQVKEAPLLILDPPRSGLKNLNEWVEHLRPEKIFYISCHHATQLRDLKPLWEDYSLESSHLFDFFPSTFHFETLMILKRRDC
jgi:23S rRNA (uracil1939-C5)-methyltransferase